VTKSDALTRLVTRQGTLRFPAYVPVTTFGEKYPLDDLVRPYLPRLAQAAMVSLHYARQMKERPGIPLMVDSGGFASLFAQARVVEENGIGILIVTNGEVQERLSPFDVLEFQERVADLAFTLDFPVPPSMDRAEAGRRIELTVANAIWALENRRRRDMPIYACVQGHDLDTYRDCAQRYVGLGFDGIAIGGLVPRISRLDEVLEIVDCVRASIPDKPLHVFGLGKPGIVDKLFRRGVQSVDSSSYVKLAADGRLWGQPRIRLPDASPAERLHLALCNLAMASQRSLPLSASHLLFGSPLWERGQEGGGYDEEVGSVTAA